MKHAKLALAGAVLSIGLAGCAKIAADFATGITTFDTAINSPANQQALATLKSVASKVTCTFAGIDADGLALNSAVTAAIASQKFAIYSQDASKAFTVAYAVNSTLCSQLGGAPAALPAAPKS